MRSPRMKGKERNSDKHVLGRERAGTAAARTNAAKTKPERTESQVWEDEKKRKKEQRKRPTQDIYISKTCGEVGGVCESYKESDGVDKETEKENMETYSLTK